VGGRAAAHRNPNIFQIGVLNRGRAHRNFYRVVSSSAAGPG